ncbi:MAG: FAD-dependent oxidoreductase [Candidatus Aenigmarchaeota archaeon]|nr:FAD-dependent oxidoreductase [Candidatus Aenigmarchaeota archaeon]
MYDIIIIGGGPAGLTAALFAKRHGLDVIVLDNPEQPSNMFLAYCVENWPGTEKIAGQALLDNMRRQVKKLGIPIRNEKAVTLSKGFLVRTPENHYESRSLILSMGMKNRKADINGEEKFLGKGVSYCTCCDAPLFKNKTAVVIGGGNSAVHGALMLKDIAKKTYLIHRRDKLRAEKVLADRLDGVEIIWDSTPEEIMGKKTVEKLKIKNIKTGESRMIETDSVFIEIGYVPTTELVKGINVKIDSCGFIITDNEKKTNIPGVFSAGDVSSNVLKQITTAVSDGSVAAVSAYKYIKGE